MESKRPTRCPPATPLRNYSSRRAAQLSNELINTNRTRQKYNQPVRNKHRWPYGGCSPQPGPWIQRAARSTHPPPARPAAPPSQPPHGPARPRPFPAPPRPRRQRAALSSPRAAATGGGGGGSGGKKGTPRSRLSRASPRSGPCRPQRTGKSRQRPCPGALPSSPPHRFRVTGAGPQVPAGTRRGPGPTHAAPPAAARGCPLGLRRAARQVRGEGRGGTGEEVRGSP